MGTGQCSYTDVMPTTSLQLTLSDIPGKNQNVDPISRDISDFVSHGLVQGCIILLVQYLSSTFFLNQAHTMDAKSIPFQICCQNGTDLFLDL